MRLVLRILVYVKVCTQLQNGMYYEAVDKNVYSGSWLTYSVGNVFFGKRGKFVI